MDAMTAIATRRSVRAFIEKPVPERMLEEIVAAAMYAPSAGNEQPWHLVVIDDRALLEQIASTHPHADFAAQAPLAIVVLGDLALDRFGGFWSSDCAALTQNLLLAAHAKGLGGVWIGIHPIEQRVAAMRRLLGLPKDIVPFSLVPLGYPARRATEPENRFLRERIHRNRTW